jgi:hypothetical protein
MTEHRTDRQENGWLVCWCGFEAATAWAMAMHRKQQAGLLPLEEDPAGTLDHPA